MDLKPKTYNLKPHRGFTLIEAVVATAIFAFLVSSIVGVYVSAIQLNRKNRAERAVLDNSTFIMQFLAKEIRNGSVDYPSYPSGTIPANPDLYIENQANQFEHIFLSNQNMVLSKGGASSNLNSADVKVTSLRFAISPSVNPYTAAKAANSQPIVSVFLELTSNYGNSPTSLAKIDLESTLSTETYPSR